VYLPERLQGRHLEGARRAPRRPRQAEIDLLLVVANAAGYLAGYFWTVLVTLEPGHSRAEGAWALAIVYRLVSADYAARVPDDEATVVLHEGRAEASG